MNKKIRIFTDGACSGNPGCGGYAAILLEDENVIVEAGYSEFTTNNKMELIAVIKGIAKAAKKGYEEIEIFSDSAYVVNAMKKNWITLWKSKDWKTSKGEDVKNKELWLELERQLVKCKVDFFKVKGHNGNTFNEMADEEAVKQCNIAKYLAMTK